MSLSLGVSVTLRKTDVVELLAKWEEEEEEEEERGVEGGAERVRGAEGGTKEGTEMALRFASARSWLTAAGVDLDVTAKDDVGLDLGVFGVFAGGTGADDAADFEGVGAILFLDEGGGLNEKPLGAGLDLVTSDFVVLESTDVDLAGVDLVTSSAGAIFVTSLAEAAFVTSSAGAALVASAGADSEGFENPKRNSNARESLFFW